MEAGLKQVLSAFDEGTARLAARSVAQPLHTPGGPGILGRYKARYEARLEEEYSLQEYLELCKHDPSAYATASERMLMAIGEPQLLDTRSDPRLSRIFSNKVMRVYPAFREFYGMEETIERIVGFFRHAAQGLEERKQILYLLGPVGGGKSSLAERLKALVIEPEHRFVSVAVTAATPPPPLD